MNNNINNNQVNQAKTELNQNKMPEASKPKMEDKVAEKKNRIIGSIILVVIILGIILLTGKKAESPVSKVEGCLPGDIFSQTTGEPCFPEDMEPCKEGEDFNKETGEPCPIVTTDASIKEDKLLTTTVSTNGVVSSYDTALLEYKDKSVLFDASCNATPKVLGVAVGTRILVANNSTEKNLELKVGSRTEDLRPLHYMLSSRYDVAGEYPVSCGGAVSATISVK